MNLEYITSTHSLERLQRWTDRLSAFRYCAAYGGHANDGDSLTAQYAGSTEELQRFANVLGMQGKKSASLNMYGHKPYVRFFDDIVQIEMGSVENPYEVDDATVHAAEMIEKDVEHFMLEPVLPPRDDAYCFCEKYYPEQFAQ